VNQSFFTRKVTGYLDYKGLPWRLRRGLGLSPEVRAAGWDGGLPAVIDADGDVFWDSTSVILHLEQHHRDRAVLPDDPRHRFLVHVLEDFNDEWFYRLAVGSRWLYPENTPYGSWDLARDGAHEAPVPVEAVREMVTGAMTASLARLGATPESIDPLIEESLKPWLARFSEHLGEHEFLFGARPSLADFAFYGGDAAHFVNDPLCWQWVDESGPEVAKHTFRLTEPDKEAFGAWLPGGEVPDSLVALLAEAGRHYLPWMAEATVEGTATVAFEGGAGVEIAATRFLEEARGVMLARYVEARSPAVDEVLDAAGILGYYADHVDQATSVPDPAPRPRPADNRPYPAGP
jgi:glutathione S-transferase